MKTPQPRKRSRQKRPRTDFSSIRLVVFDFDGVFTDNHVYVFEDGREAVRCSRADGMGINRLASTGMEILVLSTETNPVVGQRCKKLGIPCVQGCRDKLASLRLEAVRRKRDFSEICFVGNDINDAGCLKAAGFPVCVRDAMPEVLPLARLVLRCPGGGGAVRELCDLLYHQMRKRKSK